MTFSKILIYTIKEVDRGRAMQKQPETTLYDLRIEISKIKQEIQEIKSEQ